ncbi:MAG: SIS domain-containing protein [Flammeovirgaceae bacterium]|jgi:arabinose-5-phosphate isomerase|nr:SIS domain-containing protein [Flammeovirgaceae bacterium]|tara:strand:+ start:9943 stop:10539 length:597 start_codon:yes stop_codon:yes gene_type:complete
MNGEIEKLLQKEIEAIGNIPIEDTIDRAVELLHEAVHVKKGKVVVSGMGKAGQIGYNISTTLSSTGTPAVFLHPAEAQHGDLGMLQEADVLFLISNSGRTDEILKLVELAKSLYPGIKLITLTGHPENELGRLADVSIATGHPMEICPLGLTPTTSTTVMTVLGDVLVVMMMKRINFTKEDYAKRHHSGYLGKKSREQ